MDQRKKLLKLAKSLLKKNKKKSMLIVLKKRRSRNYGHLQGLKVVEMIIKSSVSRKIPFLTLYTFSTENWKRPDSEINFLFDLIRKSLKKKMNKIIKQGIRVKIIGDKKGLPHDIKKIVKNI